MPDTLQDVLDLVLQTTGTRNRPSLEVRSWGDVAFYDPNRHEVVVNGRALWELCQRHASIYAPAILCGFLAHELGHHLDILRGTVFRHGVQIELSEMTADHVAGAALALAGYAIPDVSSFASALKSINIPDGEHGPNYQREQDIWSGYEIGLSLRRFRTDRVA